MNYKRLPILCVLGAALGLFETTFSTFLDFPWGYFRPIVPALTAFIAAGRSKDAYYVALFAGLTKDVFALDGSVFYLADYISIVFIISLAAERILTNYSLYASVIMTVAARALELLWILISEALNTALAGRVFLLTFTGKTLLVFAWDAGFTVAFFVFVNFVLKRLVLARLAVGRR